MFKILKAGHTRQHRNDVETIEQAWQEWFATNGYLAFFAATKTQCQSNRKITKSKKN